MLVILVVLLSHRSADAATITWSVTGPVTFTYGAWANVLPIGTPATLTMSYEANTPNIAYCQQFAGSGLYPADLNGTLAVLNYSVPYGGGAIEVNAPDGNCGTFPTNAVEFHTFSSNTPPGLPSDEILALVIPTNLYGQDLNAILGSANYSYVNVQSNFANSGFKFNGPIQPVPEPGTLVIFATGIGLLVRRFRTRPFTD